MTICCNDRRVDPLMLEHLQDAMAIYHWPRRISHSFLSADGYRTRWLQVWLPHGNYLPPSRSLSCVVTDQASTLLSTTLWCHKTYSYRTSSLLVLSVRGATYSHGRPNRAPPSGVNIPLPLTVQRPEEGTQAASCSNSTRRSAPRPTWHAAR